MQLNIKLLVMKSVRNWYIGYLIIIINYNIFNICLRWTLMILWIFWEQIDAWLAVDYTPTHTHTLTHTSIISIDYGGVMPSFLLLLLFLFFLFSFFFFFFRLCQCGGHWEICRPLFLLGLLSSRSTNKWTTASQASVCLSLSGSFHFSQKNETMEERGSSLAVNAHAFPSTAQKLWASKYRGHFTFNTRNSCYSHGSRSGQFNKLSILSHYYYYYLLFSLSFMLDYYYNYYYWTSYQYYWIIIITYYLLYYLLYYVYLIIIIEQVINIIELIPIKLRDQRTTTAAAAAAVGCVFAQHVIQWWKRAH